MIKLIVKSNRFSSWLETNMVKGHIKSRKVLSQVLSSNMSSQIKIVSRIKSDVESS